MSTRCNIKIENEHGNEVWLYRHHDGYPACTGADIAEIMREPSDAATGCTISRSLASKFLRSVKPFDLANRFFARLDPGMNGEPRLQYELTGGMHGDINHLYIIRIHPVFGYRFAHFARMHGEAAIRHRLPELNPCWMNYAEFVDRVNHAIEATNKRYYGESFKPQALVSVLAKS